MVTRSAPLPLLAFTLTTLAWAGPAAAQTSANKPAAPAAATPDSAAIERQLTAAVRRHPDSFEAQYALAEFYVQRGKLTAAIPHLERARSIDPAHYASGYNLVLAYLETGKLDAARQLVTAMLEAKATGELHNLLGDVEERAGNLVAAAEAYQRAAHADATEDHLFDWGNNLLQLRASEPATEVFSAGVKRFPKSARLQIGLGIALYSRGQYDDAVRSFCRASDLAPSDPRPIEFLGEMYGVSPELGPEITTRLARFVKAQPRHALGHYYYAMNLWKDAAGASPADLARVEALLRRAVALDATLARAFLQLGILLSEQRRYDEAVQALRTAVTLEPELAQAHFRLAQAYRRNGQTALADEALARFEQLKAKESPASSVPK